MKQCEICKAELDSGLVIHSECVDELRRELAIAKEVICKSCKENANLKGNLCGCCSCKYGGSHG